MATLRSLNINIRAGTAQLATDFNRASGIVRSFQKDFATSFGDVQSVTQKSSRSFQSFADTVVQSGKETADATQEMTRGFRVMTALLASQNLSKLTGDYVNFGNVVTALFAGRLVGTLAEYSKEVYASVAATLAQRQATLLAAQASVIRVKELSAEMAALVAAGEANTVYAQYVRTQQSAAVAAAVAARSAATGATIFGSAAAILGGPAGIITVGATALALWAAHAASMKEETDKAAKSVKALNDEVGNWTPENVNRIFSTLNLLQLQKTNPNAARTLIEKSGGNSDLLKQAYPISGLTNEEFGKQQAQLADDMLKAAKDRAKAAATLTESVRTPEQVFTDELARYKDFLNRRLITEQTYNRAALKQLDDYLAATVDKNALSDAEIQKRFDEAVNANNEALGKLRDKALETFQQTRTPQELFIQRMKELKQELDNASQFGPEFGISEDTFNRAALMAVDDLQKIKEAGKDTYGELIAAAKGWGDQFTNTLADMVMTGKLNFHDLAKAIIADLVRIAVYQAITKPVFASIGIPGFANGGVMSSSGPASLKKYASGGIATSPQMAIFGEGSMAEAFVPLPDGRSIPVKFSGSGQAANDAPPVTVNIYASAMDARGIDQVLMSRSQTIAAAVQKVYNRNARVGGPIQ